MKILEKHITRANTRDKNATKKRADIYTSQSDVQVGDVFLVIWPDNKSSTGKKIRPALVIKRNASTAVCASITTHNPRTENGTGKVLPGEVQIPEQAAKKLGLKKASTIRLTEQHIIPVKYLIYCVTTFDTDTMNYINDELKALKSSNIEKYDTSPVNKEIKRKQNSDLYKQSKNLNESYFWEAKSESAYRNRYTGSWRTILPNNAIKVNRNDYKKVLHDKDAIAAVEEYFNCHKRAFQCVVSYWVKVDDNGVKGFINPNNRRSVLKYETDGETEIIEDLETLNNSSSNEPNFDIDDIDWDDVPEYNKEFAEEIYNCIDSFLDKDNINENFINKSKLKIHFNKHCLAGSDKKSTKTSVYYDFNNITDYRDYEEKILNGLKSDELLIIDDLGADKHVIKAFMRFFEGGKYLLLDSSCGFHNNDKSISILLYSFSSDVTTNYFQNTITIDIFRGKTTYTMYPVDANYLEQKLNNIIKKYCDTDLEIKFTEKDSLLTENIEKHDELNPKLWNEDGSLKEEVHDKILEIANSFMEDLKQDGIKFDLKDIILVGSNCSYNYTKDSDLDVHLIADSSSLNCPDDLYPLLYSSYRSIFNKNLDIDFYGIPVEIYVEVE